MPLAIPLAYNVSPSITTLVVGSVLGGAILVIIVHPYQILP